MTVIRPNVLLVHGHDLGRFLGCYGVPTVHTPNLDAFAADGVFFEQAFCTAPQCSPSRASLFTGRYPHSTGVMGLTQPPFDWDMRPGELHVAQLLKSAGYVSALVGIHHESRTGSDELVAQQLGFDIVQQRSQRGEDVTELATAQLARLAAGDSPFYLQVGYLEPHRLHNRSQPEEGYQGFVADYISPDASRGVTVPAYLRDDKSARTELAEVQGAVRYLDTQIGRLLETVRRLGLEERTIVVFTTDHGLALPRAKCSLYDPGLEVALMMRSPAHGWVGGARATGMVSNVDVVPTLLDALGLPVPNNVEGRSFRPLLDADDHGRQHRSEIFAEITYHTYYDPRRCVRTEQHKLIANFTVAASFMDCSSSWHPRTSPTRSGNVPYGFHPPIELYDLSSDPLEETNLAGHADCALIESELTHALMTWMRETSDPLLNGAVTPPLHQETLDEMAKHDVAWGADR